MKEDFKETYSVNKKVIMAAGKWNGFEFTEDMIDKLVQAFKELKDKRSIPLKLGHSGKQKLLQKDGYPAAGWITNIYKEGKQLLADISNIPKKIKEFIEDGGYKGVSVEIQRNWMNGEDKKVYPFVLRALSLLGEDIPAVVSEGINQWEQFYQEENEDIIEINFSENIEDEELKKRQALEAKEKQKQEEMDMEGLKELQDKLELTEKEAKDLAEREVALKEENEKLKAEQAIVLAEKKETEIDSFIADFSTKENMKIIPAQKLAFKELLKSFNDEIVIKLNEKEISQKELLKQILDASPDLIDFKEGSDFVAPKKTDILNDKMDDEIFYAEKLEKKIQARVKKDKISYNEAYEIEIQEEEEK